MNARQRFITDAGAQKDWANVVHSEIFQKACEAAMLCMFYNLPKDGANIRADCLLEGAKIFLQQLEELAKLPQDMPSNEAIPANLDHEV